VFEVTRLDDAKASVRAKVKGRPWYQGLGIGLVDDQAGLIVSVSEGAREEAERVMAEVGVDVPVRIRESSRVRARESSSAPKGEAQGAASSFETQEALDSESLDALRRAAMDKFSDEG